MSPAALYRLRVFYWREVDGKNETTKDEKKRCLRLIELHTMYERKQGHIPIKSGKPLRFVQTKSIKGDTFTTKKRSFFKDAYL